MNIGAFPRLSLMIWMAVLFGCSQGCPGHPGVGGLGGWGGSSGGSGGAEEGPTGGTGGGGGAGGLGGEGGGTSTKEPYSIVAFDRVNISSLQGEENFQRAGAAIDFRDGPFEKATMVVELESPCFPFSKWKEPGAIPPGHNWPTECDAYDRTFSCQLLPSKEGEAGLELVRAITPFGGPMRFEVDVTDIANGLHGQHELQTSIDTWPDGEGKVSGARGSWFVSASFEMVPGTPPRTVLAVIPLFNGSWSGPGEDQTFGPFDFVIPEGTRAGRLEYRATGHGGGQPDAACIGHADEFCKRSHSLWMGDRQIAEHEAWTDCDDACTNVADDPDAPFAYCAENPCAHPQSAVAPRANWCPGKITGPLVYEHEFLNAPGEAQTSWKINKIADGGSWRVSGIFFAYGE